MASIQIELNPFLVPTGATVKRKPGRREDGFRPAEEIKLADLPYEVLDAMCNEFRTGVMEAAGRSAPRKTDDGR